MTVRQTARPPADTATIANTATDTDACLHHNHHIHAAIFSAALFPVSIFYQNLYGCRAEGARSVTELLSRRSGP